MIRDRIVNLAWIFFEKFGLVFLSMVSFYLYALLLTPEQLGIGVLVIASVELLGVVYMSMIEDPMVRLDELKAEHISTMFWAGFAVSVITVLIISIGSYIYFNDDPLFWLVAVAALKIPFLLMARVFVVKLRRQGDFKSLASRTLLAKILGSFVGVAVAFRGYGYWAIIIQSLLIDFISFAVLFINDPKKIPLVIKTKFLADILRSGLPVTIKAISSGLLGRGVNLVLGLTAGPTAVGIFNMAFRLVDLPRSAIWNGLLSYALPVYSRRKDNLNSFQSFFYKSTELTCILLVPIFVGLGVVAEDVVLFIFGNKWEEAIPILQVLSYVAACSSTVIYVGTVYIAVSKTNLTIKAEVFFAIVSLLVVYLLGELIGAMAGAIAILFHFVLFYPVSIFYVKKAIGVTVKLVFVSVWRSLVSSIIMALAMMMFRNYFVLDIGVRLFLSIVLGVAIYVSCYTFLHKCWLDDLKVFLSSR